MINFIKSLNSWPGNSFTILLSLFFLWYLRFGHCLCYVECLLCVMIVDEAMITNQKIHSHMFCVCWFRIIAWYFCSLIWLSDLSGMNGWTIVDSSFFLFDSITSHSKICFYVYIRKKNYLFWKLIGICLLRSFMY